LALTGYEFVIVAAIILALVFWGPKKLPEFARAIGLAKKEFTKATAVEPDPIVQAAKNLGISTEGKTREQLEKEVAERKSKSA
jgi:sec-independent protein translocase protein TatA